jgi:hypothetical protein
MSLKESTLNWLTYSARSARNARCRPSGPFAEHEQDVREEVRVLAPERQEEQEQQAACVVVEHPDHAQVEQVEPVVVAPEQVARVRVGVEEALGQHLAVEGLEQLTRRLLPPPPRRGVTQRPALDLIHDEQAPGGELVVHGRNAEPRVRRDHLAQPVDVCRLFPKSSSRRSDDERCSTTAGMSIRPASAARPSAFSAKSENSEVALDLLGCAGPLHLHDHALTGLEFGAMHLADRAGRQRHGLDALEDVLPRDAELLLHHLHDLGLGQRRDLVLERRQLVDELGRDQVGAGREDLTELAERRPELLECRPQARRAVGSVARRRPQAVLRHDRRDLRGARGQMTAGKFGHELLQKRRFFGSSAVFTITTVQRALCETRFGTLPSRNSFRPAIPMLPTTSTSASSASAAAMIAEADRRRRRRGRACPGAHPLGVDRELSLCSGRRRPGTTAWTIVS